MPYSYWQRVKSVLYLIILKAYPRFQCPHAWGCKGFDVDGCIMNSEPGFHLPVNR